MFVNLDLYFSIFNVQHTIEQKRPVEFYVQYAIELHKYILLKINNFLNIDQTKRENADLQRQIKKIVYSNEKPQVKVIFLFSNGKHNSCKIYYCSALAANI